MITRRNKGHQAIQMDENPPDSTIAKHQQEHTRVKDYELNSTKAIQKKMDACNRPPLTFTQRDSENQVITFNTASLEIAQVAIMKCFRLDPIDGKKPSRCYEYKCDKDQKGLTVCEVLKIKSWAVIDKAKLPSADHLIGSCSVTMHIYRTSTRCLINGKCTETLMKILKPALEALITRNAELIRCTNIQYKNALSQLHTQLADNNRCSNNQPAASAGPSDSIPEPDYSMINRLKKIKQKAPEEQFARLTPQDKQEQLSTNLPTNLVLTSPTTDTPNPQPYTSSLTTCPTCCRAAKTKAVQCDMCDVWKHYRCEKLEQDEIDEIESGHPYTCLSCMDIMCQDGLPSPETPTPLNTHWDRNPSPPHNATHSSDAPNSMMHKHQPNSMSQPEGCPAHTPQLPTCTVQNSLATPCNDSVHHQPADMMYYAIPEQLIPASQGLSRLSKATIAQKADMMHYAIPEQLIPAFQGPSRLSKATIAQKSQKTKPKVKGSNVPPPKQSCNDPSQQFIPVNTLPHLPSALQVSFVTPSTNAVSKGYAPMPPTTSAQSAPTNPEKVQLTQDLEIKEKQLRAKERSLKIRETALRKQELELQEQTEQCNALKSLTNSLETKVTLLQDENRLFKLKLLALEDVQHPSPTEYGNCSYRTQKMADREFGQHGKHLLCHLLANVGH